MKKIIVFTSARSEYGLLKGVIHEVANSNKLQLQLLVSGTHLSADFGMTINEIKDDEFKANESSLFDDL